ncbi:MAG: type II toxin-antitoxin system death-on-curing family toxin [Chloroflexi bacterium]|nr:type II toxin-antitoxin system death-on-curing family toxin [Chloroflexota bacterium]
MRSCRHRAYPLPVAAFRTLTVDDVCRIHEALTEEFAASHDPIAPPGVKSQSLLESAVGRQHAGFGPFKKYATPVRNAASLTFGLCKDHPFHNGNKRTALVAMLAHLDANKLTLKNTKQGDLFEMILAVANDEMYALATARKQLSIDKTGRRSTADAEVNALSEWLENRLQQVKRGEKTVTYRELRPLLKRRNIELREPHANSIGVFRVVEKKSLIRREVTTSEQFLGRIGYHSEGDTVSHRGIKEIRRLAGLREEDGCDSEAFYGSGAQFDVFINQYRTILRRLARR